MLLVIPTPIGNLQDMTERAKAALSSVDVLLCEDTRTTGHLISLYGLERKKLLSYHKHNEHQLLANVLELLKEGKTVGLASDAGTPCIADPGALLVQAAYAEGIQVSALPGPSACITALSMSGLIFSKFQFVGFLPRQQKAFEEFLSNDILPYQGVTVAYESPERISDILKWISALVPDLELVLMKELTKIHERVFRGTSHSILEQLTHDSTRGEWIVLFSHRPAKEPETDAALTQVRKLMKECDLSLKTAVQVVALLQGISKNRLYQAAIERSE